MFLMFVNLSETSKTYLAFGKALFQDLHTLAVTAMAAV